MYLLGFYAGGIFKDASYFFFLKVPCRHGQRGAAFEVNREAEAAK